MRNVGMSGYANMPKQPEYYASVMNNQPPPQTQADMEQYMMSF